MQATDTFYAARAPSDFSERSRSIQAFAANRALVLLALDVSMLAAASWIAIALAAYLNHVLDYPRVIESALIWTATSIWTFKTLGLYRISYALQSRDEWYYVVTGLGIGVAPLLVLFTIVPFLSSSRFVLAASCAISVVLVGLTRSLVHRRFDLRAGRCKRRIAIVGSRAEIDGIAKAMNGSALLTYVVVPTIDDAMAEALAGAPGSWYANLRAQECDEIVFAGMPTPRTAVLVERAARDRVTIGFAPPGMPTQAYPLDVMRSRRQPILVAGRVAACTPLNMLLKRLFDVTVASIGCIVSAPILLLAMLAVVLDSGFPIFFRQIRIGKDDKPFEILKLRSMVQDAEAKCGAVWSVGDPANDRRTTRIGAILRKTSIDELPQFFNVLRGDMSIVGPRPERPVFVEQFRKEFVRYDERHLVRPGVTGWAHVHMRRGATLDQIGERLDLDLFYVENYSLLLDIFVTFKTAVEVLFQPWS